MSDEPNPVRRLVKEGQRSVADRQAGGVSYRGPERPVPEAVSEASFARLLL